jgi:cytochrome c peroxidase
LGRFLITKKEADIAAFKTPDMRNVLVTGPYFHDGSQERVMVCIIPILTKTSNRSP